MKKIILVAIALLSVVCSQAQNATNSPYSQYGYGQLADQSNGASKGMAGLGLGWREGNQVNFSNPASYSAIDSLTFIFDAGVSAQVTNFTEGGARLNANNSSFDYVMGAFRMFKHVGMSFGVLPYSNVGYNYHSTQKMNMDMSHGTSTNGYTNTYAGEGGIHQIFIGMGVEPIHAKAFGLSVGANMSYLWGDYTKSVTSKFSDSYVNTLNKSYGCDVKSYKLDLGAQLQFAPNKNDKFTLGASYSFGHELGGTPECLIVSNNSQTGVADTTTLKANGKLALPTTYGVGLVWNHKSHVRVGFDYKVEQWGDVEYPVYKVVNDAPTYSMQSGLFQNRERYTLGLEYCVGENSRKWINRVKCRAGFSYATPYLYINGQNGPKEMTASFGFGLPIINGYNNRSVLNISAQWTQQNAKNMIKENTFCINVGLTFNECWFAKWKLE